MLSNLYFCASVKEFLRTESCAEQARRRDSNAELWKKLNGTDAAADRILFRFIGDKLALPLSAAGCHGHCGQSGDPLVHSVPAVLPRLLKDNTGSAPAAAQRSMGGGVCRLRHCSHALQGARSDQRERHGVSE